MNFIFISVVLGQIAIVLPVFESIAIDTIMNTFLKTSRLLINSTNHLCIVLGNESCDLDSAVSAISLAFFHSKNENRPIQLKNHNFLPLLNINRNQLKLKTEVIYFLASHGIDSKNVLCRDEIPENILNNITCHILVDHHISPYQKTVKQVFDHRPLDKRCKFQNDCIVRIEEVGSCATLIADYILNSNHTLDRDDEMELLDLLYAPIILDTINFNPFKTKPLDIQVSDKINHLLNATEMERKILFRSLQKAQFVIDTLTAEDLLVRDLKIVSDVNGKFVIPIISMPMLADDYTDMQNVKESIDTFHATHNCCLIIILGRQIVNDEMTRDFYLLNCNRKSNELFDALMKRLLDEPMLGISDVVNGNDVGCLTKAGMLPAKISRKQILPIVQEFVDELACNENKT